jgi:hypothetical protein
LVAAAARKARAAGRLTACRGGLVAVQWQAALPVVLPVQEHLGKDTLVVQPILQITLRAVVALEVLAAQTPHRPAAMAALAFRPASRERQLFMRLGAAAVLTLAHLELHPQAAAETHQRKTARLTERLARRIQVVAAAARAALVRRAQAVALVALALLFCPCQQHSIRASQQDRPQ